MNTFGERLRAEREKKGFSQKDFADCLEITPTRLNYWEKNKREPDFYNIKKMIAILNCDADWLIGTKFSSKQNEPVFNDQEQNLIKKYRDLPPSGKATVDAVIEIQHKSINEHVATHDDKIEEELEDYRKELEAEQKGRLALQNLGAKKKA